MLSLGSPMRIRTRIWRSGFRAAAITCGIPGQKTPATPWEAEIDDLMRRQQVTQQYAERKRLFDRVQQIMVENQPMIAAGEPQYPGRAPKRTCAISARPAGTLHTLEHGTAVLARRCRSPPMSPGRRGMEQYAAGGGMPGRRRARLERAAGSLQEPDLFDPAALRRAAPGRGRHFPGGLPGPVQRTAPLARCRSAAGMADPGHHPQVLPLEAARRRRRTAISRRGVSWRT